MLKKSKSKIKRRNTEPALNSNDGQTSPRREQARLVAMKSDEGSQVWESLPQIITDKKNNKSFFFFFCQLYPSWCFFRPTILLHLHWIPNSFFPILKQTVECTLPHRTMLCLKHKWPKRKQTEKREWYSNHHARAKRWTIVCAHSGDPSERFLVSHK